MLPPKLNLFWKIIAAIIIISATGMVLFRSHYLLGTMLIVSRWFLFLTSAIFLYTSRNRIAARWIRPGLVAVMIVVLVEYRWNTIQEERLLDHTASVTVSLMTYNIFFKNSSKALSLKVIKEKDPDILFVQELTPEWASQIKRSLGQRYLYTRETVLRGTHGIGVYAKFPIVKSELLGNATRPFAQIVTLNVHGKELQVVHTHLASPAIAVEKPARFFSLLSENYTARLEQLKQINDRVLTTEMTCYAQLLIGDLNTTYFEPIYRDLKRDWVDLSGVPLTPTRANFPNTSKLGPIITLDYIFGRGRVSTININVVQGGSSDHLAIFGKIRL
ncbi:endonuclease/exonuclease/phosphatase family protein [Pseudochryseolinea flava]|uniref:Endonuclease/exonuclease/phosphatase domain-containing protein n=1 Tax=Pseudochryseolinea flava TaxID=2059302 RepID=A0A364Y918_9BACT|nr:endonuclease/exonuclease/phosphatase family protein [Pseudochryseolinea flava]RAW02340.1 hypothetical protein DQQ10_07350 [Pseudochryseolinea flava]